MMAGSRVITVDQGNSSIKVVEWTEGRPSRSMRLFSPDVEALLPMFGGDGLEGCVYCGVGHTDARFVETIRCLVDGRLLTLTPSTPLPIEVEYGSRSTLGNDRVAAAVGAWTMFPDDGSLVVDAGTAVTLDVVCCSRFLGGNIAPGLALRFSSLHDATERLPLVGPEGALPDFGTDTVSAIRAGVLGGMASEICFSFSRASELYGCRRVLLAGSDAGILFPVLTARGVPVEAAPDLVGLGLLAVFRHNMKDMEWPPIL